MAHHKDAIKRIKQNEKIRARNRAYRSRVRNQVKAVREAVAAGNPTAAQAELKTAVSVIHRGAHKGILHRNAAARKISRLNRAVKAIATR